MTTATIPVEHDPAVCPACSLGTPCRVVTRRHRRYWQLYRDRPAVWGPVLVRDAAADAAGVDPAPPDDQPAGQVTTIRAGAAYLAMEACEYRAPPTPGRCACFRDCSRFGRVVSEAECLQCQGAEA